MTLPWLTGGSRRWLPVVGGALLAVYVALRIQIFLYDRKIEQEEAELAALRPAVIDAAKAKELDAAVTAQQRLADTIQDAAVAWEPVFQRLASTLPSTMVLHTVVIDGTHMSVHGVLRLPPPDPQSYLAAVAAELMVHVTGAAIE